MLPTIILAVIFAKIKKYRLSVLLKAYALFPFFCVEVVYLCFQASVLLGNYTTLQYASYLKSAYLYLLLFPVLFYQLYKPAFIGAAFVLSGTVLNKLVIWANNGKMPVFPTLSRLTGYFNESAMIQYDSLHCLGTTETRLKFLTDYIDLGFCVLSIGDIFIRIFIFLIVFYSIKELNRRQKDTGCTN